MFGRTLASIPRGKRSFVVTPVLNVSFNVSFCQGLHAKL